MGRRALVVRASDKTVVIGLAADSGERWLEALAFHQTRGSTCSVILSAIDAWLYHLTGANGQVDDPLAEPLHAIVTRSDRTAAMQAIFGGNGVLKSAWHPDHSGISIEASS